MRNKSKDEYIIGEFKGTPIELCNPSKDEIIVVKYKFGELSISEIKERFDLLRRAFPDNAVIVIPDSMTLDVLNKSKLRELRDNLLQMIDKLINDDKS